MSDNDPITVVEELPCSFEELCRRRLLDAEFIRRCVESGIGEPLSGSAGGDPGTWVFSTYTVLRIEKAQRLHRDLDIDLNGMALVLDLLEELDEVRLEAEHLRRRLRHWEHGF